MNEGFGAPFFDPVPAIPLASSAGGHPGHHHISGPVIPLTDSYGASTPLEDVYGDESTPLVSSYTAVLSSSVPNYKSNNNNGQESTEDAQVLVKAFSNT